MSTTVTIYFNNLSYSLSSAKNIVSRMEDYEDDIQKKVMDKLSKLPGDDASGNIADAIKAAGSKKTELSGNMTRVSNFKNSLDSFISDSKAADGRVAKNIKSTGNKYVGKRTWYQKIGDFIYDTFCVDFMNSNPVTKFIGDCVSWVGSRMSGVCADVYNWFKYKEGKYVWNLVKTITGVVASVAGFLAAIAAISLAGPIAAIITITAAVAAGVIMLIAAFNSYYSVTENIKAYKEAKKAYDPNTEEGNIGIARYRGNINSFSEYNNRTDQGDEKTNSRWKTAGQVVDGVETTAEIVSLITSFASFFGIKNANTGKLEFGHKNAQTGKWNYSKKDFIDSFKKNIKEAFGFKRERYVLDQDTGKKTYWNNLKGEDDKKLLPSQKPKSGYKYSTWRAKNLFGDAKGYFGIGKADKFFNNLKPSETTQKLIVNTSKIVIGTGNVTNKIMKRVEKAEELYRVGRDGLTKDSAWDTVKAGTSTFDFFNPFDTGNNLIISPLDKIIDFAS